MRSLLTACLCLLFALSGVATARAAEDPPGRVARLSYTEGEVSVAPAGTQEWAAAVLNRPLTSEDRLWVDPNARAELQIDSATVHLDSSTELAFLELDDDAVAMRLNEGRASVRVLRKREGEDIEVDTPNVTVALLHPGEYHIEVDPDGEMTVVKVRSGEAEVRGESRTSRVRANEMGVFRGADALSGDIASLGPRTTFEDWANERASRRERSESARYVSESVIGYEDLDDHGRWVYESDYGYVWQPTRVVVGWAPYRDGRWTWISPWGWTWIDHAPWGFAPFHYGRWAYVRHRWCWVPGPRHAHAVYAPALVAWLGGPHVSVNIALGHGVGWFPLGPREIYVPGYWHSHRYFRRVNVSNTIIVNHVHIDRAYRGHYRDFGYRFRDSPHAVTVVEREHFVRGRPVGRHVRHVSQDHLRRWGHHPRPPAIAPQRESIFAGQPHTVRFGSFDRSRHRNAGARGDRRVSFERERNAIEANGDRPVKVSALVERNPKEGRGVAIPRSRTQGPNPRLERERRAAGGVLERMPANERAAPRGSAQRDITHGFAPRDRLERRRDLTSPPRVQRDRDRSAAGSVHRSERRSERSSAAPRSVESRHVRPGRIERGHTERELRSREARPTIATPRQIQPQQMRPREMRPRAASPGFEQRPSVRSHSGSHQGRARPYTRGGPSAPHRR